MKRSGLFDRTADRLGARLAELVARFAALSHREQRRVAILLDAGLCIAATWIAFALRLGIVALPPVPFLIVLGCSGLAWILVAWQLGFYRTLLRFAGGRTMVELILAASIMSAAMTIAFVTMRYGGLPRTMGVLQPMTFVGLIGISRLLLRFLLVDFTPRGITGSERIVAIYGAGRAGQQLSLSIRHESHIRVVAYFDDDWRLHGQRIEGCPILNPDDFASSFSRSAGGASQRFARKTTRNRRGSPALLRIGPCPTFYGGNHRRAGEPERSA